MPCHTRMKRIMQGLLWLFLLEFGCLMVMSLEPGYLDFDNLPDTNFSCVGKVIGGYYADLETNCQMFHVCTIGQLDEPMDIRFLCLNGTVFDQETRVCERIDEVDCSKSEQFYSLNLELYGNTQPPILEEEFPVEIKRSSSTTTTTTTTTQRPSNSKSSSQPYYTTSVPPTTTRTGTKVITSHHFPVVNSPDIRFNPEEINISLNPGAPPDITRSQVPISFQQQSYSNSEKNTRVTVTTHTTVYKNDKPHRVPLLPTVNAPSQILVDHENIDTPKLAVTTEAPKSVVSYGLTHNQGLQSATPTEINYGFTYQQTEESVEYNTEVPPHPYQYQISIANLRPPTAQEHPYHSSYLTSSKRPHKVNFPVPTTYRNHPAFTSVRASSSEHHFESQRTDKPPRLQLPLPLLPTLPPLTFSSPAPFSLGRHIETKRYTNDHQSPPRIIISASASVSDNSGRRLNYSLGTIGASHLLGPSPATYDEYKEDDVGLDPFYHDVPKIKSLRHKRSALREEDVIKNDQEAADLLKFLFNWYNKREKMRKISIPVASEDITEINDELAPIAEISTSTEEDVSQLFDKINKENVTEQKLEQYVEAASLEQEVYTKDSRDVELEDLAKMLDILNKTQTKISEESHIEAIEVARVDNKTNPLNETHLEETVQQVPISKLTTKKPKQGRNHRRRAGTSRTTPSRTKPRKSQRKVPNRRIANTPRRPGVSEKSHEVDEAKNATRNASHPGRLRMTNGVIENSPKLVPQIPVVVGGGERNVTVELNEKPNNLTKTKEILSDLDRTVLGNTSSEETYEPIKQEDLSKIYKLLGEEEPANSFQGFNSRNTEKYVEEDVETHESKQHEHIITTHDSLEFMLTEKISTTENINFDNNTDRNVGYVTNTSESVASENTTPETDRFETNTPDIIGLQNTTLENITTGPLENQNKKNGNVEEHYTENSTKPIEAEEMITTTIKNDVEYASTTLLPNHEHLDAQPSSYRNEDEETNEHSDYSEDILPQDNIDDEAYEIETEKPGSIETSTENLEEENYEVINRTDKPPEELDEATLHIDLLNLESNPQINDKKVFSDISSESLTGEVNKITEISEIDITTSQPELESFNENTDEEKNVNIALTPRHKSRGRLTLPRNNFKFANRRTYEAASSEEELSNNAKLSTISLYKGRIGDERRKNNYIRNRKFIANQSPSKNVEKVEITKGHHKEKLEKDDHKENNRDMENDAFTEENPIIPDYVDDNYEPLTYHESPNLNESENLITTTHQDQDFEENTVTDFQNLNNLEHSTDFSEVSDLHDHTSERSHDYEEVDNTSTTTTTTTTSSEEHEESNTNQEEHIETTPITQDDYVIATEASYELLTEATTSAEQSTTERAVDEETTEPHFTTLTIEITTSPTTTELINMLGTTPELVTTTTIPESTTSPPSFEYSQTTNAYTESTIDMLKGPGFTTNYPPEETTMNAETTQATTVAPSSTTDSSNGMSTLTEPELQVDATTPMGDGTTNKYQHLKTRLPWYKRTNNAKRKEHARHRFTTNTRRLGTTGVRERTKLDNKITHVLNNPNRSNSRISADKLLVGRNRNINHNNTAKLSDIESVVNSIPTTINNSSSNILEGNINLHEAKNQDPHLPEATTTIVSEITTVTTTELIQTTLPEEHLATTVPTELERSNFGEVKVDIPVTDAPLLKSANPTKAKYTKIVFTTTPLSKFVRVELRKDMHGRRYSFNCFNKKIHQFYSDARDCRLFHYCTLGYTKNQMVDMKFVCDAGTYFDEEKLVCTKVKPARCL